MTAPTAKAIPIVTRLAFCDLLVVSSLYIHDRLPHRFHATQHIPGGVSDYTWPTPKAKPKHQGSRAQLYPPTMAWIVLVVSGVLETVWASALSESRGFSRPVPSVVFGISLVLSMAGLGYALQTIPVGTGYAVWVGIGAVGTALYGIAALGESTSVARLLCLTLIVAGVVGLKLAH